MGWDVRGGRWEKCTDGVAWHGRAGHGTANHIRFGPGIFPICIAQTLTGNVFFRIKKIVYSIQKPHNGMIGTTTLQWLQTDPHSSHFGSSLSTSSILPQLRSARDQPSDVLVVLSRQWLACACAYETRRMPIPHSTVGTSLLLQRTG